MSPKYQAYMVIRPYIKEKKVAKNEAPKLSQDELDNLKKAIQDNIIKDEANEQSKSKDEVKTKTKKKHREYKTPLSILADEIDRDFAEILQIEAEQEEESRSIDRAIDALIALSDDNNMPVATYHRIEELLDELYNISSRIGRNFAQPLSDVGRSAVKKLKEMASGGWRFEGEESESLLPKTTEKLRLELSKASDLWAKASEMLHFLKEDLSRSKLPNPRLDRTEKHLANIQSDLDDYDFLRAQINAQRTVRFLDDAIEAHNRLARIKHALYKLEEYELRPQTNTKWAWEAFERAKNLFQKRFFFSEKDDDPGSIQICQALETDLYLMLEKRAERNPRNRRY